MEGVAEGAQVAAEDIFLYNLSSLPQACSNLVFLTPEGPLLGHVNDDLESRFDVAFHLHDEGRELLHVGLAGSVGTGAAVNSLGLAVSHAAARSLGLRNREACLTLPLLRRALIEGCRTTAQAEAFLTEYGPAAGADNIIVVDQSGEALVAERLPTQVAFRRPTRGALWCTGRALTSEIRAAVGQDEYETKASEVQQLINRERYFEQTIEEHADRLSTEVMMEALRSREPGIEVCNELSNWAAILKPRTCELLLADRPPASQPFVAL